MNKTVSWLSATKLGIQIISNDLGSQTDGIPRQAAEFTSVRKKGWGETAGIDVWAADPGPVWWGGLPAPLRLILCSSQSCRAWWVPKKSCWISSGWGTSKQNLHLASDSIPKVCSSKLSYTGFLKPKEINHAQTSALCPVTQMGFSHCRAPAPKSVFTDYYPWFPMGITTPQVTAPSPYRCYKAHWQLTSLFPALFQKRWYNPKDFQGVNWSSHLFTQPTPAQQPRCHSLVLISHQLAGGRTMTQHWCPNRVQGHPDSTTWSLC